MDSMDSCSPIDLVTKGKKKLITSGYVFCILKVFSPLYGSKTAVDSESLFLKYQPITIIFTSNIQVVIYMKSTVLRSWLLPDFNKQVLK